MAKLLQLSVLIALIAIPTHAAMDASPEKGLKKALRHAVIFNILYLFILLFVYGRLAD